LVALKGPSAEAEVAALIAARGGQGPGAPPILPQLEVRIDTFALPPSGDRRAIVVLQAAKDPSRRNL
jgi:hypothetical protein